MLKCPECKINIADGAKHCPFDGRKLMPDELVKCQQCKKQTYSTDKYCRNCGIIVIKKNAGKE